MGCLLLAMLATHYSCRSEPRGGIVANTLVPSEPIDNATVVSDANIPQSATVDYMRRGHPNEGPY